MMKLFDITSYLESIAPTPLQESYDNVGLIVGSYDLEVKGALICLDCTESVIDDAIAKGCNLVIAHHPIVFSALKRLNGSNYVERTVIKAIKNDIAIYAIHTNLDNVDRGVNKKIADLIGLENCRVLDPKSETLQKLVTFVPTAQASQVLEALFKAGAGQIGNYDQCSFSVKGTGSFRPNDQAQPFIGSAGNLQHQEESRLEVLIPKHLSKTILDALFTAHPYEDVAHYLQALENVHQEIGAGMIGQLGTKMAFDTFITHLKKSMNLNVIKSTTPTSHVARVAVCGGSGSFLLNKAKAAEADVFISSDFKYHEYFDADGEITVLDIGHYESERFTIDLLFDLLSENFPSFALLKTEVDTNPVKYL